MPIQLLDRDVAAKIAAGEVIERPASVVKELVENALDAGTGQIEVELNRGGLDLIRVTDDGEGVPAEEMELTVIRHATSKLRSERDLTQIETLGFRGEALASIAAVARLTLVSRAPGAAGGSYIISSEGEITERGQQGAPVGTTAFVRDLFKSVPARLAFLRSTGAETARCLQVVQQYALAYPEVAFRMLTDGRLAFHSPGAGQAQDVLVELWGPETAAALMPIQPTHVGNTTVTGFIGPPDLARARRNAQVCFVNRRWVETRILSYAVADAFRDLVPRGRYPVVVLFVQMSPEEVDVNVHPTKMDVRFRREGEVIAAVQRAMRTTLAAHGVAPAAGTVSPLGADVPLRVPPPPADSDVVLEAPPLLPRSDGTPGDRTEGGASTPVTSVPFVLRPVGQVGLTYIVAEGPDGMYLVDQHAAHERIVFEELLASRGEGAPPVQGLLEPLTIPVTASQMDTLTSLSDLLASYGFEWEPFGEDAVLLRAVPASVRESSARETLMEVLDGREGGQDDGSGGGATATRPGALDLRERRLAATVACHSTVRAGQTLTVSEMDALLQQFQAASYPRMCPHGRPTMVHLSATQLERQFGRR